MADNQEYSGPYTEAHLQDGTVLQFKGDLDPISVKQKVTQYRAGVGGKAPLPTIGSPGETDQGGESEAQGTADVAKEHPYAVGASMLAGAAAPLAAEVPGAIGAIGSAVKAYPKLATIGSGVIGNAIGSYVSPKHPIIGGILRDVGQALTVGGAASAGKAGPGGGEAEAPQGGESEPEVVRAPEPREPTVGERPGSQFSVPREQLPSNIKSGQPGAGEAYRSIGGKVIYTPPTGSEEPYHPPGIDQEPSQPTVGNGIKSNARADLLKPAENRPEWVQQQHEYEINRLKGILRNDKATPEERDIAQSQLDNMRGTQIK